MSKTSGSVCAECGKPAISMCPYCCAVVHQAYGLSGTCGLLHEQHCVWAQKSREPLKLPFMIRPSMPIFDTVSFNGNGQHRMKATEAGKRGRKKKG